METPPGSVARPIATWGVRLLRNARRRSWCRTTNTNRSRNVAVGTTKKSMDARQPTWFRRNVRQVCDGGFGCRIMYLETVAWLISIPSLRSSPWMRGAPHNGFSRVMRRISVLTSAGSGGRPRRRGRDFQVQKARKPLRCQAITVSGLTITAASRQRGQRRYRKSQNIRSRRVSRTRTGRLRWRTSS